MRIVATEDQAINPAKKMATLLSKATENEVVVVDSVPTKTPYIQLELKDLGSFDPLVPGEIGYQVDDGKLRIWGSDSSYLYYAVYEFLENELGFRWLDPVTDFTPKLHEIKLPTNLHYTYSPEIATRTVHARLFYEHPAFARKHRVTNTSFPYYAPQARVHTFHRFLPRDLFLASHPEYFALRYGRRISTQLCLTHPEVLQIVIDSVRAHFNRTTEAQVVSVSQDDNTQYCTCASCVRSDAEFGGPAGTMIRFVNQVAEKFPDKIISTLAYQYTRKPGLVKPAPNVLITLCSIECDRSGSIEEKCTAFAEDLKGWNDLGAKLRIWDYTTQFTNFLAPFPNLRTLQPNIRFFRNNQTKWVFEQHSHQPSDLYEIRAYTMAKLLWNPDLNVDSLMEDFAYHYYGPAGEHVLSYIQILHDALDSVPDFFLFLYGDPAQGFNSFLDAEKLTQYHELFEKAELAIAGNDLLLKRVRKARIGLDYATLEACRKGVSEEFSLRLNQKGLLNQIFQAAMDRFESTCRENNITMMNEMRYAVEEYLQGWEETISRASQSNLAFGKSIRLLTAPKKYANEDPQVLTDGAFGGASFYANWLGFEGNHMVAEVDLGKTETINKTSIGFLQVVNHLVFLPAKVTYSYASEDGNFERLGVVENPNPLTPSSKINEMNYYDLEFDPVEARFLKIEATSLLTPPDWHHGAGLPSWIFADEWIVR